ncbi:MAG: PhoH family protein [Albidovulum sp.]|nr:PhoH family protein [Albidovulum sp.]
MESNIIPERRPAEIGESHLEFPDNRSLIGLCGELDRNLSRIESSLGIQIVRNGNQLVLIGGASQRQAAGEALHFLYSRLESGRYLEPGDVDAALRFGPVASSGPSDASGGTAQGKESRLEFVTRRKVVEPRTDRQKSYVRALIEYDMVFGIGPAGTGKTYLAVAAAVSSMLRGEVDRIILSRPAVEAGENLGFLPGDLKEKVDPYMKPLFNALHDFLPSKQVSRLIEDNRIEIAPLAYMRGRTLSNAFVVLDEAQNATSMQMKMFLTRLGPESRMVITGDVTQIDLPRGAASGLIEAEKILRNIEGIGFSYLTSADVVRHAMVAKIINAYGLPRG